MSKTTAVCPACGARLKEGAVVCDLCGMSVRQDPAVLVCQACGHANPAGARYCNQCGATLPGVRPLAPHERPAAPAAASAAKASGRAATLRPVHVVFIVVGGVLLVGALYLITLVSGGRGGLPPAGAATQPATLPLPEPGPIPAAVADQVAALEAEIARLEGTARLEKQQALVNLLIGIGRPDRAALIQEEIARRLDTPEAWRRAGNLFYDWMEMVDGPAKTALARRVIAAYQRVLDKEPDNLDVRADMAIAYLYDPDNPMEAVRQTRLVLAQDSTHIQANFNLGIMLLQINRLEEARAQFEKVQRLVGPRSPLYAQADTILQLIRRLQTTDATP
ncbi:zinc ribbon domain-containing protein [Rhodothermus profundi]|uniref:Double zinc ribbon n=1 Tax=Rhodothermus profundi TaxID=633813 RepID=A0A1M6PS53_9BACT|nr:zinc ribbon domain-containing protein [Rhodothermus profundi]SHK10765.1 Double zinc ribbon [Rhodothermus profundi]